MTIVQEINKITVAHGGTPKGNTISQAIDALNDALAGSDQPEAHQIDDAIELLGQHIGGGSSVTVESLTATENKTYTAPSGKAYSPVTVNVSGGSTEYNIYCINSNTGDPITSVAYIGSINEEEQMYEIRESATPANSAQSGEIVLIPETVRLDSILYYESGVLLTPDVPYKSSYGYNQETGFAMPQNDILVVVVSNEN